MKKLEIENVLNQKRLLTHLMILLVSVIVLFINMYIGSGIKSWQDYAGVTFLVFIQIETFIFIAHLIFRNMNPGTTPGEITRIVISRFAVFLAFCLVTAFILFIGYIYIRQIIAGGDLSNVFTDFTKYSFTPWLKATTGGLAFGAAIFITILWQEALRREQRLREQNLIFQNETLKNQVNPHFLFNSLNTLSSLIDSQPDTTKMLITRLSSIYRYILDNGNKDKVPLRSELAFISDYFDLHKIRDEEKILLTVSAPDADKYEILPVSLQILLENAIKHNMATRDNPLKISIYIDNRHIVVKNNLQKMAVQFPSTKIGLKNLSERVRLITGEKLIVEETAEYYKVKIPLLS